MKVINYVEVPATQQEDINQGKTTWRDGKCVMLDEGRHVTLYIGHKEETRHEVSPEGETTEKQVTLAFPVRVEKPLTKDKAINAAEMQAYGLADALAVASLAASMARKWRENINDVDVSEHDTFIRRVKRELDKTGLFTQSASNVDAGKPTLGDMVTLARFVADTDGMLTDEQAVQVKRAYPQWSEYIGKALKKDKKVNYGELLYKVRQDIAVVLENQPPSIDTAALYEEINETNAGTKEDPIPYNNNMKLIQGKYYSQYGVTYYCKYGSGQAVHDDLESLKDFVEPVE